MAHANGGRPWRDVARFTTKARDEAERAVELALAACSESTMLAQLSDLADAVDALRDGILSAALTLARASMLPHPEAVGALRPEDRRQTVDEIRAAYADYRAKRQSAG